MESGDNKRSRDDDDDGGATEPELLSVLDSILQTLEGDITEQEQAYYCKKLAAISANKKHKTQSMDSSIENDAKSLETGNADGTSGTEDSEFYKSVAGALRAAVTQLDDDTLMQCSVHDGKSHRHSGDYVTPAAFRDMLGKLDPTCFCLYKSDNTSINIQISLFGLEEQKRESFLEKVRDTFSCGTLLDYIHKAGGLTTSGTYIEDLVEKSSDASVNSFVEASKTAAVVVSGESGSGKSTFVKNEFTVKDSTCIYHSLDTKDFETRIQLLSTTPTNNAVMSKIRTIFQIMESSGLFGTDLHDAVSNIHYELYQVRNKASENVLESIFKTKMFNRTMLDWWDGRRSPIEKLVLIIDEAGKCESFARGLVDSVRQIHQNFIDKKRCKKFKLVIAGSGLDAAIERDSLLDTENNPDTATFGTDPGKSNVVVLQGPKVSSLQGKLNNFFIKRNRRTNVEDYLPNAIANGTYSRVLSTNTRMLFDGIIPILEEEKLTSEIEKTGLEQRLVELCSSNIVMDFAARSYMPLNGLKDLTKDQRQKILSKSFLYLLRSSYEKVQEENKHMYSATDVAGLSNEGIEELTLKGLVASDPLKTSSALRYLACNGHSEELVPADGISFEGVLSAHLRRFEYTSKEYPVVLYTLQEAWPGKSLKKFEERSAVHEELKRNFNEYTFIDVRKLSEKIQEIECGKHLAIVMKQRVPSAQSADVIVLEVVNEEGRLKLCFDLFQAKHYSKIPGVRSKKFGDWVRCIGVRMPIDEEFGNEYSQLGIEYLGSCLKTSLEATNNRQVSVEIRGRFLVVSKRFIHTPWDREACNFAKANNVTLWTRENLEPTISATTFDPPPVDADKAEGILDIESEIPNYRLSWSATMTS